jgi:hypothetical protein
MERDERSARTPRGVSKVYDAYAGGRNPVMDGPWWLGAAVVASVAVLALAPAPWKWLALAFLVLFCWLPIAVRWAAAVRRSPGAFRDGSRS